MRKWIKITIILVCILLVATGGIAFYLFGYHYPYEQAANAMPQDQLLQLHRFADGSVQITWPAGENADRYLFRLLREKTVTTEEGSQIGYDELYSAWVTDGTSHTLNRLPDNEELVLQITSYMPYTYPFEEEPRLRPCDQPLQVKSVFTAPAISQLQWQVNTETKQVAVSFQMSAGATATLYKVENGTPVAKTELTSGQHIISYGEGGTYPMPAFHINDEFCFSLVQQHPGYIDYGVITDSFTVAREDLLGTVLELTTIDYGTNQYTFTWNETKGEYYELQQYDSKLDRWITLCQVPQDGERTYTTGHLTRYSDFKFRVVALGGSNLLPDSDFAATPDESSVSTGASVVFSMIWPIQTLEIYDTPTRDTVVGNAPAGQTYCVMDLVDGMFKIRYGHEKYGYIDSNYCLINLPDMIGNICLYNITNSYASLFMVHEFVLPGITNTTLEGYENVRLSYGNYLVPLLYPTALKLEKAAFAALEDGYKLKIYDAFRPHETTRTVYDETKDMVENPIPEKPFTDVNIEDLELPELKEGEKLSYEDLMTDFGRYNLSYFLAKNISRHNQGLALDLTIVKVYTGKELEMQSSIHDLSWYSERNRNTKDADILSKYLTNAGFGTLVSEWWHYQDNEAMTNFSPEPLQEGISPECWVLDDTGWRYRMSNGKHYYSCTRTIDGVRYTFDENCYVIEAIE